MIIESENQYQAGLLRMKEIIGDGTNIPKPGTQTGDELQDLLSEIKIYENKYYHVTGEEIPTFEFWSPKEGVVQGESQNPDDYEIVKLKENELTEKHITILAAEFLNQFDKLPAAAKRRVRQKLKY